MGGSKVEKFAALCLRASGGPRTHSRTGFVFGALDLRFLERDGLLVGGLLRGVPSVLAVEAPGTNAVASWCKVVVLVIGAGAGCP